MFDRKKMIFISMIISLLMIVFGVLLLMDYQTIMERGSVLIGALFLGGAIFFLVKYIANRNVIRTFDVSLLFMVFCIGFGILFIWMPNLTETLFKIIIGLLIIAFSIFKGESLLVVEKEYTKKKITFLVLNVLGLALGLGIIFNIGNIFQDIYFSVSLVVFGLVDIVQSLYLRKMLKETM